MLFPDCDTSNSDLVIDINFVLIYQEYNALFYETSAKLGSYINESMLGLARYVFLLLCFAT